MASDTPAGTAALVVYQAFPRNHGPNGTLADVTADLPRIRALGVDVLYLMPIHPIGVLGRKGGLGSPFAVSDFRAVNPELGTDADFDALIERAHALGLRVLMDVVFNHTSPDSVLVAQHPEFYHRDAQGRPVTSVPQWTDIIDLAHPDPALWRYLIDTLALWVRRGVDGFRVDSAALTPLEFWRRARAELADARPGLLWLAEAVHPDLIEDRRARGLNADSDAELYAAFDMQYTYDMWPIWQSVVTGTERVARYLEMIRWQGAELPSNAVKLRHVENHDNFRIRRFAGSPAAADAWTALTAFLPGAFMIQAGQEAATVRWTDLFDRDPIEWDGHPLAAFLTRLTGVVKHPAQRCAFRVLAAEPVIQLAWGRLDGPMLGPAADGAGLYGLFDIHGGSVDAVVQLPDGEYADLLGGGMVAVVDGRARVASSAAVLEFERPFAEHRLTSTLLDVFLHVEHLGDSTPTLEPAPSGT